MHRVSWPATQRRDRHTEFSTAVLPDSRYMRKLIHRGWSGRCESPAVALLVVTEFAGQLHSGSPGLPCPCSGDLESVHLLSRDALWFIFLPVYVWFRSLSSLRWLHKIFCFLLLHSYFSYAYSVVRSGCFGARVAGRGAVAVEGVCPGVVSVLFRLSDMR